MKNNHDIQGPFLKNCGLQQRGDMINSFKTDNAQKVCEILCNKVYQNTSKDDINHDIFIISLYKLLQILQGRNHILHLSEYLHIRTFVANPDILTQYRSVIKSLFLKTNKNNKIIQDTQLEYSLIEFIKTYLDKYFLEGTTITLIPFDIYTQFQSVTILDSEQKILIGKVKSQEFKKITLNNDGNYIIHNRIFKKQQDIKVKNKFSSMQNV